MDINLIALSSYIDDNIILFVLFIYYDINFLLLIIESYIIQVTVIIETKYRKMVETLKDGLY